MGKTIIERYADMIKSKLKTLDNLKAMAKKQSNQEIELQITNEKHSLKELLTNRYYRKLIDLELKQLYNKYIKGD